MVFVTEHELFFSEIRRQGPGGEMDAPENPGEEACVVDRLRVPHPLQLVSHHLPPPKPYAKHIGYCTIAVLITNVHIQLCRILQRPR